MTIEDFRATTLKLENRRAAAVQAAAEVLGDHGYYRRDIPGGGIEYLPSKAFTELAGRIGYYIQTDKWEGPTGE